MTNVLILNYYSRAGLAICKYISKEYTLLGSSCDSKSLLKKYQNKFLKHPKIKKVLKLPHPDHDKETFVKSLVDVCQKENIRVIVPCGTNMTDCVSDFKDFIQNETGSLVLAEDKERHERFANKWELYTMSKNLNIKVPKSHLVHEVIKNPSILNTLNFPVVVKPLASHSSIGVKFFNTKTEFIKYILKTKNSVKEFGSLFLQEKISGSIVDVNVCSKKGKVLSIISQKRLQTFYDFGGGGIINETYYDSDILASAEKLVDKNKWSGVAQFEYIKDKNNDNYLIECNPKFWGTTELTFAAGLNMINQYIDFSFSKKVKSVDKFEEALVFKWFFPTIFYSWIQRPYSNISNRIRKSMRVYSNKALNNISKDDFKHSLGVLVERLLEGRIFT